MVVDVSGNIGDLIVIETASEGRHGVLSVGHLQVVLTDRNVRINCELVNLSGRRECGAALR